MSETVQTRHIEVRKTRRGDDKPYIVGTRIAVEDVFVHHEIMGKTPDEIVESYPQLSLAQVHAALSYAFDHIAEIRKQMKEGQVFAEAMRAQFGPGPLEQKLSDQDAGNDSVSS